MIDRNRLREALHYDPSSGAFTRRVRTAQRHQVGDRADMLVSSGVMAGYRRVTIDSQRYLAHRLAWFYVHGVWPNEIDHRDGDKGNNAIENLRDVSRRVNKENIRVPKANNRSGFLGVQQVNKDRWTARIFLDGKSKYIGTYLSAEAAHEAYVRVKRKVHEGCTI